MVTIESTLQLSDRSFRVKYSSDLSDPEFYIYLDGRLVTITTQTEYVIGVNPGENYVLEILDDSVEVATQIFPGKIRLGWFFCEGCDYFLIDEYVSGSWQQRMRIKDSGGYLSFISRFLEDGQSHRFRIVPVGTNGNTGQIKEFVVLMVRYPDEPDVDFEFDSQTGKITIT